MQRAAGVIFFVAWLLCGCAVETIMDDWRSCLVFVVAMIVTIVAAAVITGGDGE